jgi:hypothetical protein
MVMKAGTQTLLLTSKADEQQCRSDLRCYQPEIRNSFENCCVHSSNNFNTKLCFTHPMPISKKKK